LKGIVNQCVEHLSFVYLSEIDDLEFLPKELFYRFTNLWHLVIEDCKSLQMSSSLVQHFINDVLWKEFRSLQSLRFCRILKLEYLPNGMRHVTTLQDIYIGACPNSITLPEWIGELTTLSNLMIYRCPKLSSLPEGIHHLRSLELLRIRDSPKLIERYKEKDGEDWQKNSHIRYVDIS